MRISILSFTRKGAKLSLIIKKGLAHQVNCYAVEDFIENNEEFIPIKSDLKNIIERIFFEVDALVFIGATGIAVRAIAPFINDKRTDPAVISIDEKGTYVIPILSGHIGGANSLSEQIAKLIGAVPIITTATDINNLFSVDKWAKEKDLYISDMSAAKRISALLVDGKSVGLISDFKSINQLPHNIVDDLSCKTGICISYDDSKKPFENTLNLIPKAIYLGIGCRKNATAKAIEDLVLELLRECKISIHAVKGVASIDLKKDEPGLLEFAEKYNLTTSFYDKDQLKSAEGCFNSSEFVLKTTGVDNVCERSAVLVSGQGNLISTKKSKDGVTVAIAEKKGGITFEY
jgi:cobalt-precorrin 5A hydrolase